MGTDSVFICCMFLLNAPFVAIGVILAHYLLRRARWRRGKRTRKKRRGFHPSSFALAMAFQFMQVFVQPSMAYVLEAKLDERADEDDDGDPETVIKQLSRQLKRIRRGETVERLVLRL